MNVAADHLMFSNVVWSCSFNVHPSAVDALQLAKRRREPRHIIRATSIVIRIPLAFQVQSHVWSFEDPHEPKKHISGITF